MTTITIQLPTEAFSALRKAPEEFAKEMRLAAAIHWYQQKQVSLGKAAEIAGLNKLVFMDELAQRKINVFHVDLEDLKREIERD